MILIKNLLGLVKHMQRPKHATLMAGLNWIAGDVCRNITLENLYQLTLCACRQLLMFREVTQNIKWSKADEICDFHWINQMSWKTIPYFFLGHSMTANSNKVDRQKLRAPSNQRPMDGRTNRQTNRQTDQLTDRPTKRLKESRARN